MSNDKVGSGMELRIMSRIWNGQKVSGGERACFCIQFASDAETGTCLADGNGFCFMRPAVYLSSGWLRQGNDEFCICVCTLLLVCQIHLGDPKWNQKLQFV